MKRIETDSAFHLTPEQEEELVAALHDIRSGNFEDGDQLLRELKEMARRDSQPR